MTPPPRIIALLLLTTGCESEPAPSEPRASSPTSAELTTKASALEKSADQEDAASRGPSTEQTSSPGGSPAEVKDSAPGPAAEEADAAPEEKVGGLEVGMPIARVKEILPGLKPKGKRRENGESGLFEQTWESGDGVSITVVSEARGGDQTLDVVRISTPSTLKSAHGIGIGDSVDAVKKAYGDAEVFDDALEYDLISFTIKDGKVASFAFGNLSCATCG